MTLKSTDTHKLSDQQMLSTAREAMTAESDAIKAASAALGPSFVGAAKAVLDIQGKVVVTGLGKSGHIARKIAATLASTGTPSFFLHPSEALHGDLGMISSGDALLAIAFGGETSEVVEVARFAKRVGCVVTSITGKVDSSLAKLSNFVLDGSVSREVCPLNLAPTASTAVALSLGDALAVLLMAMRGFSKVDFAGFHPGGSLGRKLSTVSELMRDLGDGLPFVPASAGFHDVLAAVTKKNFGIVPVVDEAGRLSGAISDGDIRRALLKEGAAALQKTAKDIMTVGPRTVFGDELALEAFRTMEKHQITSLFVLSRDASNKLLGLVRMHDLLTSKIV